MAQRRKLTSIELQAVSKLPAAERYFHSIKEIADWERLWTLGDEDGSLFVLIAAEEILPVWPHQEYAAQMAYGPWQAFKPVAITLSDWLETWLPGLSREGKTVTVLPTPGEGGFRVTPEEMLRDIDEELGKY